MKNKHGLLLTVLLGLFSLLLLILWLNSIVKNKSWWRFATQGEIYTYPLIHNGQIYFGNNAGEFYSLNADQGEANWLFKTGYEMLANPVVYENKVFFMSTDSIYGLDIKTGKEIWREHTDDYYRFVTDLKLAEGMLIAGDAKGGLYSFSPHGKQIWKFNSKPVRELHSIFLDDYLNWFGKSFAINNGVIYWGSVDGHLYAISAKKGKLRWKFDSKETITTSVQIKGNQATFGNKKGELFLINIKNGKLIKKLKIENSYVQCAWEVKKSSPWEKSNYIISLGNGKTTKIDQDGKKLWSFKRKQPGYFCPVETDSTIYIGDKSDYLFAIDKTTGKEVWRFGASSIIRIDPILDRLRSKAKLLIGDDNGSFYALDPKSGTIAWSYKTRGGISTPPLLARNYIYLTSSDGGLYKIDRFNGKATFPFLTGKNLKVSSEIITFGKNNILELSLNYDEDIFSNPWKEVLVSADLIHQNGKKVKVDGFYYDKNTWKLRFNPPLKGTWRWDLKFAFADRILAESGSFNSLTDTKQSLLKISKENPKRLTLDGKTIFNGLGIQDTNFDYNYNGNHFDDWAVGLSDPILATLSGSWVYFPSDKITDLQGYLSLYGRMGGFNLYRYNILNASFGLWRPLGVHSEFLLKESKWADTFLQALKKNDYQVWMTIFGFSVPFPDTTIGIEKKELEDYLRYVVARYGSYVSIWEISNETMLSPEMTNYLANLIKNYDFEKKPISISWEQPEHQAIDIISPHWYETEAAFQSDTRTVEEIEKFFKIDKPVIFGEQGNHTYNWDPTSALRMRVRTWTAYFNEGILIFWNWSDRKYVGPKAFDWTYANQYIGEEERKYMKIMQDFTKNIDLSAKKSTLLTTNPEVRGYLLSSNEEQLGYLYKFVNQELSTETQSELYLLHQGKIEWIDPTTGKVILSQELEKGYNSLFSPSFNQDLAFKIRYQNNAKIK